MLIRTCAYLFLVIAVPLLAQVGASAPETTTQGNVDDSTPSSIVADDQMTTPTQVTEAGLPLAFSTEVPRTNYLYGTLKVQSAYENHVLPVGTFSTDIHYSVWPTIDLALKRTRTHLFFSYSPGFTLYQGHSEFNHIDHDLAFNLTHRLSPRLTFILQESFQKSSTLPNTEPVTEVVQRANDSIVPPVTDRFTNFSDITVTYQVGPNSMLGVNGTLSELWYGSFDLLRIGLSSGLFNSATEGMESFYTHRLSKKHQIGAMYELQKLLVHPNVSNTHTQSMLFFDTLSLRLRWSVAIFAGPQYSDTHGGLALPLRMWSPEVGGSLTYQGASTSFVISGAKKITDGGGLSGAVRANTASVGFRHEMPGQFTLSLGGRYETSTVLNALFIGANHGRTVLGGVSLRHPLGQHLNMEIGYSRLNQKYSNIVAIGGSPNQDYAGVSLSYQFERGIGR